jgi:hypothetical protein
VVAPSLAGGLIPFDDVSAGAGSPVEVPVPEAGAVPGVRSAPGTELELAVSPFVDDELVTVTGAGVVAAATVMAVEPAAGVAGGTLVVAPVSAVPVVPVVVTDGVWAGVGSAMARLCSVGAGALAVTARVIPLEAAAFPGAGLLIAAVVVPTGEPVGAVATAAGGVELADGAAV